MLVGSIAHLGELFSARAPKKTERQIPGITPDSLCGGAAAGVGVVREQWRERVVVEGDRAQ